MLGFAKILESNESGYSGDKPNQRGKFILVPNLTGTFFFLFLLLHGFGGRITIKNIKE